MAEWSWRVSSGREASFVWCSVAPPTKVPEGFRISPTDLDQPELKEQAERPRADGEVLVNLVALHR
jgi:hypothetical protein